MIYVLKTVVAILFKQKNNKAYCHQKPKLILLYCSQYFPSAGRGTHGIPAAPLERGEVCSFPDGDPPARLTHHQVLQYPT